MAAVDRGGQRLQGYRPLQDDNRSKWEGYLFFVISCYIIKAGIETVKSEGLSSRSIMIIATGTFAAFCGLLKYCSADYRRLEDHVRRNPPEFEAAPEL